MNPDVVVVGAGLAGLATAWHLAPRARVLVLDQGEQAGAEASAQNAGMVRRLGEDPYERALAVRTAAWLSDPGEDWEGRAPSRVVGAVLGLARDPQHLHDGVAHLRARGVAVAQPADPVGVAPILAGSPLTAAWWVPDERVADAWSLIQGFLAGLRRHGGALRTRTRVLGLRTDAGRVTGVDTDQGPIEAGRVLLAAGAWSAGLVAPLGLRRPLIPLRRTLVQTLPHPASRPDHPWVWIDDEGVYARPEGGGWLVSGCDEAVDPPSGGPGSRGPLDPALAALALDKIARFLPALADARVAGGWSGLRTFAPDRRPVLGEDPELAGLWWAAGLGGFGVTCGYAVGEVVATWMDGRTVDWLSPRGVSPGRAFPTRLLVRSGGVIGEGELHRT
ncbi:MAG: FAD-binding oxidoreductase [Alphaproteobacteria bacterium]|nr:FAD-binding oxidoreductase [Alphaproteobacteria bacterium]MCB9697844.1 FAD-binding oxidoreductase [Alphaproteobacteria bacterium]